MKVPTPQNAIPTASTAPATPEATAAPVAPAEATAAPVAAPLDLSTLTPEVLREHPAVKALLEAATKENGVSADALTKAEQARLEAEGKATDALRLANERLARMEKAEAERQAAEQRRELSEKSIKFLNEKGMTEYSSLFDSDFSTFDGRVKAVENLQTLFAQKVEAEVIRRISGEPAPRGGAPTTKSFDSVNWLDKKEVNEYIKNSQ